LINNQKVKLGVIGVGHLGQYHVKNLITLPDVELVGIVDTNSQRAQEISHRYNVTAYPDYRELVGKVDGVTIVVPTLYHYEVGKFFLEKGIHTLLEKPITSTLKEASELVRLSKEKHAILQVGHVERFNAGLVKLREYIKNPMFIEGHRLASFDPRVKDIGVVMDLMIHDIDIVLSLIKSEIRQIDAIGVKVLTPYEDIANARITFQNGCIANLTASRISPQKMRKIRLFQEDGYFSLDYMKPELEIYRKVNTASGITIIPEKIVFDVNESLKRELESFVQSVQEGKPPLVTGEKGKDALEVALEITEQINQLKLQ
jgi:predicted dehydrogenase